MNSFYPKIKGFLLSLILFFAAPLQTRAASDSDHRLSYCQIWERDIESSEEGLSVSRNYQGLWLSEKCEIQPGPLFLLRQYRIHRNGRFHLVQYRYSDPYCSLPSHSVIASGTFVPSPEKATSSLFSWVVQGAVELDYVLHKVSVIPYTVADGYRLSRLVNRSCPSYSSTKWRPYRKYRVLSYSEDSNKRKKDRFHREDIDCTQYLDLNFNELQLSRLERRSPYFFDYRHRQQSSPLGRKGLQSFLLLGAAGSDSKRRPTYYQPSLVLASESPTCPACHALPKATPSQPPKLHPLPFTQMNLLKGEWMSMQCEVRPHGMFVKRRYIFDSFQRRWYGTHSYYKYPSCTKPMFRLSAIGNFLSSSASIDLPSAWEYDFQITEASLTPQDVQFVINLNGLSNCGPPGVAWKLNLTSDITISGGCRALGIIVPSTELDILKFEQDQHGLLLLYLGETAEHQERPTSFQPALIQCSSGWNLGIEDHALLNNKLNPLPLVSGIGRPYLIELNIICILIIFHLFMSFIQ